MDKPTRTLLDLGKAPSEGDYLSLILASASPRRAELLASLGLPFEVLITDLDETRLANENIVDYATRLALEKAQVGFRQYCQQMGQQTGQQIGRGALVLGADTCGEVNGQLLNKPTDFADAKRLLGLLSNNTHTIYTAFALYDGERVHGECVASQVSMRAISDAEMLAYWQNGEPCDKAGAYGIQGLGSLFISHLVGSYSAVMGLPLFELGEALKSFAIEPLLAPVDAPTMVSSPAARDAVCNNI